ncbi:TPA: hypothetical protein RQK50_003199 [Vibrio vulnificus]|nr:hypothetical protein [Vibrio vulnificus]HDY7927733.1 hypothetical protein [Vibrio vulnificus]
MLYESQNSAILVLESPWELDEGDSNRSSVLPFVEGVAKMLGDTEVYHANFYDKSSFNKALDCLCKKKFSNTLVYIAAHGSKRRVGNTNIMHVLRSIGEKSNQFNITGIMLGACFVGGNTIDMEIFSLGNNLRWCAGYASSAFWLPATLIDCAIMSAMLKVDSGSNYDRDDIIDIMADALSIFDGKVYIGENLDDQPASLEDSLEFVLQPKGRGFQPKSIAEQIFAARKGFLLNEEEY